MFLEKEASLAPIGAFARSFLLEIHSGWSKSILREYPTTSVKISAATAERKRFRIKLERAAKRGRGALRAKDPSTRRAFVSPTILEVRIVVSVSYLTI